jgi:flavin-dependent dehydrogenase
MTDLPAFPPGRGDRMTLAISGAGPAGLAAAITAARAGVRATVFERRSDVGGRFHGDFQALENWTTRGDVLEEFASIGIAPTFPHVPVREAVFFDPRGREYRLRSPGTVFYLVTRGPQEGSLDSGLHDQATAAGVEIRFGEECRRLPEGGIVTHGPRAADVIAVGYVFQTSMPDGIFTAFSDELAPKGYSYLAVHAGRGTVASCLFEDFHSEKTRLARTVEFFERRAGLRMQAPRFFGGTGNFGYPSTARQGSILFAGEAAGFQDDLWGFGIRHAVLSGSLAARAWIDGRVESYDRLWRRRLGGLLKASAVNRRIFAALGDRGYPRLLARLAAQKDPRIWLRKRYAGTLAKALAFSLLRRISPPTRDVVCPREGCDCTWCRCGEHGGEAADQARL